SILAMSAYVKAFAFMRWFLLTEGINGFYRWRAGSSNQTRFPIRVAGSGGRATPGSIGRPGPLHNNPRKQTDPTWTRTPRPGAGGPAPGPPPPAGQRGGGRRPAETSTWSYRSPARGGA